MDTAGWALIVSILTALFTGFAAYATWQYAKDTRKQVEASTHPIIEVRLEPLTADDALKPTTNPETYFQISFTNTHFNVRVLDLKYSISVAVVTSASTKEGVTDREGLKYGTYHSETVGTLDPGAIWSTEAQFQDNEYTEDEHGKRPTGRGLETFIKDYLPEYREQQVVGQEKYPLLAVRIDFNYRPASRNLGTFSERWYTSLLVSFGRDGKLGTILALDLSTRPRS